MEQEAPDLLQEIERTGVLLDKVKEKIVTLARNYLSLTNKT